MRNSLRWNFHHLAKRCVSSHATGKEKLTIQDVTLRDGEQGAGTSFTLAEKIDVARRQSRIGVDICQAGFPFSSEGEFFAVNEIAKEVGPMLEGREIPMRISGLARIVESDILRLYEAVKKAPLHRICVFIATSDIHLEHKLNITRSECLRRVRKGVKFACNLAEDVQFSAEDGGRTDQDFLVDVFNVAAESGAKTCSMPDTVGYQIPQRIREVFEHVKKNLECPDTVRLSTHCHNDLGLATANSLFAILGGARQVDVTVNGIGERAGNAAFEEVVMALKTRSTEFPVSVDHIHTEQISELSRVVSAYSGMQLQRNKAIVGANAFAHSSGIHQDGILKNVTTYEIMKPESVGASGSLPFGKLSGKRGFMDYLGRLGIDAVTENQINVALKEVKSRYGSSKNLSDEEVMTIVNNIVEQDKIVNGELNVNLSY